MSIIEKIKNFFKSIFGKENVKMIEGATESVQSIEKVNQEYEADKKEIFDIYQDVKKKSYDLSTLTEEQTQKIVALLEEELKIKKDKLDKKITELNMLKYENKGLENKLNGLAN